MFPESSRQINAPLLKLLEPITTVSPFRGIVDMPKERDCKTCEKVNLEFLGKSRSSICSQYSDLMYGITLTREGSSISTRSTGSQ